MGLSFTLPYPEMTGNLWYILLAFIPALINVGIIFYLIFFLPRSKTTNIFTFFVIALILWQAQDTILRVSGSVESAAFWYKALCVGWMYVGALSFHFTARYTGSKKLYTTAALICIYLPFFVLQALAYASVNKLIFIHDNAWGWIYVPRVGTVDSIQRYWVAAIVVAALFILFRHAYKMRNHKEKKLQALIIAFGMLIPTLQGIITQVIFPLVIFKKELPVTSSFMTFFSLATIISLSRYKLFNVTESITVYNVLENLTNKVFVISPEARILYVNPHAIRVFGIKKDDHLSPLKKIFPDEDLYKKFYDEVFSKTISGETIINYETTFLTKANKKIEVLVSTQVIKNNNVIQGILLVANNITDRVIALRELNLSNERYKYVTQTAFDAIWDWDIKTRRLYLGDTFGELFGYQIENNETDFSSWASHIHPDDQERIILSRLNKIIYDKETSWQDEYRYICADGSVSFVSDRGILLRNSNSTYRMIGAMQDISQRKRDEERILNENQLKQKEITEAVIAAQESERSEIGKEMHDNINQLLGASHLYIETARKDTARSESLLATASKYTLNAIEEIRKLSKTLISPDIKETGLADAVNDLLENIKAVQTIKINFYTKGYNEKSLNEKFKLNVFRIIQEQLNNTLKYAKAKTIDISFIETDSELLISISDDGVGFDTSLKRKGVGISNIYSRAELYKGVVIIDSKPGAGCTLTVNFMKSELLFDPQLIAV